MSANLWGQEPEPINLANCTIEGVDTYYHYTGSAYTITQVVKDGEITVDPTNYNVSYTYNGAACTGPIINKGLYVLTISGKESYSTGTITKAFSIYGELEGEGTGPSPWQISSAADWEEFASHTGYWGGYVVMTSNVPNAAEVAAGIRSVSTKIGTESEGFMGVFDGKYNSTVNTLTFSGNEMYGVAPFFDTYGATIKNLKVEGNIVVNAGWAAGLIYMNYGETNVENVTIGVNITDGNNGSAGSYCGGFAVQNLMYGEEECILNFSNCVYNGKMMAETNSGGFCANYNEGSITFTDCLFDPAEGSAIESGYTFGLGTIGSDCYYTNNLGTTEQGKKAYLTSVPSGNIGKFEKQIQGFNVYKDVAVVHNVKDAYAYTGSTISITPEVSFDGVDAITNGYCTAEISPSPVQAVGTYTLTITPDNTKGYYGSYTKTFKVVKLNGDGSSEHPYEIASTDDWNCLAVYVNDNGESFSGKYVHLTNDITVSTMVGTPEHPFSGDFSGLKGQYAANTLTFNYGTSANPTTEEIVAPFRYTDGAYIHSLIVDGAIYTNVGKEAGLIGVNTRTSANTTVQFVINKVNFYCYEDLLDAEGGGYAYDGSGISFIYSSYEGTISANNYHGGFCGNASATTTSFSNCLFNPTESGFYWAENFVYNLTGTPTAGYFNTSYYTVGHNQEESEQGTMVFVNTVPEGNIGHKLTTFHEKVVYEPVEVVITGVNKRYTYTGENITITPTVTFNGVNALTNNYCQWSITPSYPMHDVGQYTFTLTAPKQGVTSDYLGTIKQIIRVVESSSSDWAALQDALSGPKAAMDLDTIAHGNNIKAGTDDFCLVVESGRTVTINLKGRTINRGFYDEENGEWGDPVIGGQVLKIASGATVIINGPGTIMGGCNKASSNTEHAENSDAGGIYNMGSLTLNGVTIEDNYCEKKDAGVYRTARGGGIYSGIGSTLIINNCTITHNEAKGGGGGLFVEKAAVFMMDNTIVQSNVSQDKGGGIRVNATNTQHYVGENLVAHALINDCVISYNTVELHNEQSASNGGGIHLDAGILDLTNCIVNNNICSKFGGGIYLMGGTINADNCSINSNFSYDYVYMFEGCGGGVCILGGTFNMNGGTITDNTSNISYGGGIYVASGKTLRIKGSVNIYGNWTLDEDWNKHKTNVYLAGENGQININGNIQGANVGVSKYGNTGVFTNGLNGKGTTANFSSDNSTYSIVSYNNEAKLTTVEPVTPPYETTWTIDEPVILNESLNNTIQAIVITNNGCLYVNEGGYISGVSITNNTNNAETKLIINGGQVIPSNSGVPATVKKDIEEAFASSQENWYLISSPLVTPTGENPVVYNPISILDKTNLIVKSSNNYPEYDLYRFNEGATVTNTSGYELQWENYRAHSTGVGANFTTLEKGRGYLYRNYYDYTITMTGAINIEANIDYTLSYNETVTNDHDITHDNIFKGFNIIGNPYTHNISKGITGAAIPNTYLEAKYYVLDQEDGSWDLTDDGTAIPPVTGILVQATEANTLTITNSTIVGGSKGAANNNIWFTVANNRYDDRACVEFRNGRGLNKIAHPNENVPMLYIRHNDEDFASVDMNPEAKQFDLYFEAATLGQYTLTVNPQGNYSYLHLIDKVAEEDIDLLKENEYSFIGSPSDNADRFVVRLENSENAENSVFAYQSGNEIIVSGEGELQVFDVMGRLVARQYVSGVVTWRTASLPMGVYIFRLNDKSQKIVIR